MSRSRTLAAGCCLATALSLSLPAMAGAASSPLVDELNKVRSARGLPAVRYSKPLARSATGFARRLMRANRFGHAGKISTRARFRRLGETLARRRGWSKSPSAVIRLWLRSPGHRALILDPRFRWAGDGRSRGHFGAHRNTIWVMHLGGR